MSHAVGSRLVASRHLAVVREQRAWSALGAGLIPLLDRVYRVVRAGKVIQTGQNVFLYRDGSRDGVTVEIGVEVASPFEPVDGVLYSWTPAGDVASTLHVGPYAELGRAHDAVIAWCGTQHLTRANIWWEVYGDWVEDPARLETEVFHLLGSEGA